MALKSLSLGFFDIKEILSKFHLKYWKISITFFCHHNEHKCSRESVENIVTLTRIHTQMKKDGRQKLNDFHRFGRSPFAFCTKKSFAYMRGEKKIIKLSISLDFSLRNIDCR